MTQEIWLDVAGYEGKAQVSNMGRVRSLRILRPRITCQTGYLAVTLAGQRQQHIHRLVAAAFIGPCPPDKEVHHKDGSRSNNKDSNLVYVARAENLRAGLILRGKPLPPDKMDMVAKMYFDDGDNLATITRKTGIPRKTLRTVLCKWRQYLRPSRWRHPDEDKLDAAKADVIRALHKTGEHTMVALGKMFDVDESAISRIVSGKSWRPGSKRYECSRRRLSENVADRA